MKVLIGLILLFRGGAAFTTTSTKAVAAVGRPVRRIAEVDNNRISRLFETKEPVTEEDDEMNKTMQIETFLEKKYPSFYSRLMNEEIRKALKQGIATIFVPNDTAFEELGEKKLLQLEDPRNEEIREKMGSYHIIPGEIVSAMELKTEDWTKGRPTDGSKPDTVIAGIKTQSGEVPVGREKSGGVLGWGAKPTGDIVVGPQAKIVQSFVVGDNEYVVHEMDGLISPLALWRYCDQLRIL